MPELAYSTVAHILETIGAKVGSDVELRMTFSRPCGGADLPVTEKF